MDATYINTQLSKTHEQIRAEIICPFPRNISDGSLWIEFFENDNPDADPVDVVSLECIDQEEGVWREGERGQRFFGELEAENYLILEYYRYWLERWLEVERNPESAS